MYNIRKIFVASLSLSTPAALSLFLHLGIVAWFVWPESKAAIIMPQQQIITVELLAMQASMPASKPIVTPQVKNPEVVKKKQENHKPEKPVQDIQEKKSLHSASGDMPSNADLTQNAVLTDPIFNAQYLNNPPPIYPPSAKRKNIEGEVLLKVEVSTEGKAETVSLRKSSGSSLLDNAAIRAVKRWRFIPAKQENITIAASVIVPIVFRIEI